MSQAQINRDKNALRGLYNRRPEPRTMQQLLLLAGEGIQPAVREMIKDRELILIQVSNTVYYDLGNEMKAYKAS